jgi:hypothetical protein
MIAPWKLFGRLGNSLFQYAFLYAYAKDNKLDWYYQDPKFFRGHEEEIRQLFGQGIEPIDMVAIHVRRGDYVNNPFYVDLTDSDYYDRAIAHFKGEKFLVFSDNIEWCKVFFQGKEFEFSEGKTELEDLNMMAGCKGIIMANSSFSWWGAFLGTKKKVIAPKEWFTDTKMKVNLLKQWQRI